MKRLFIEDLERRESASVLFAAIQKGGQATTLALGEEGRKPTPKPGPAPKPPKPKLPRPTTLALGEEGRRATTLALGEEGRKITTLAIGEEGRKPIPRFPRI